MGKPIKWFSINRTLREDNEEGTLQTTGDFLMNKACELRGKYPNALRGGGILQAVMDDSCSARGFAIPDTPPENQFSGGQCFTRYGVEYSVFFGSQEFRRTHEGIFGPVGEFFLFSGQLRVDERNPNGASGSRRDRVVDSAGTYGDYTIHNVYRLDGQADDCGSLNEFPDPPIDPSDFSFPVRIAGTPDDPEDPREVEVEVEIDTELTPDGEHCFKIDGRKYCLTPDGVEEEEIEEEEEEEEEEIEVLDAVVVEVIEAPPRGRTYLNENEELISYFAAYHNWRYKVGNSLVPGEFTAIRRPQHYFKAPDGVTSYDVLEVNGAKVKVTEFKKKIKVPKQPTGE